MRKDKLLQRIFICLIVILVIANLLFGLAIHYYPGGNFLDPSDEGFDFLYGAMSDLGRITAYNGESNTISRFLYTTALNLLAIFVLIYYSIMWTFFQKKKTTKWLSLSGTVLGLVQGILYIILAHSPADTASSRHIMLIYTAPAFLFGAILSYTIVFFIDKEFPRINAYSFLAMIIITVLFTIAVAIGAIRKDIVFHTSRRAGHTLFNFIVPIIFGFQALGVVLFLGTKQSENFKKKFEK
ncbi:MAG: hypothetical protein ACTSO5_15265 [Candidatus Heimdallarchaeaceae archaeon]